MLRLESWLAVLLTAISTTASAQVIDPAHADAAFDTLMNNQPAASAPAPNINPEPWRAEGPTDVGSTAEVPFEAFARLWEEAREAARNNLPKRRGPAVVLGESSYDGQAVRGVLKLQAEIRVTLGRPGDWKIVPLAGSDVVLAKASVDEKPISVTTREGYHVWMTQRAGKVTVQLELLVSPRGPRGSIEYDFAVVRTPVTRFRCSFPTAGLEPRLDAAVRSTVESEEDATVLEATLRPTTRIHILGFRDLGGVESRRARLYAETLNLLSIDENALDVFAVVRYTILYAGAKEFRVLVPAGVKVVSADGKGAFRHTLEETDQGTLLRGETAFPIRNNYEISLRLRLEAGKGAESFQVPLPRCLDVEREVGWLAVEVPGKMRLTERARAEMLAIDTRQLPPELVRSAVSPILKAYRYHAKARSLELTATRLPEHETASESIDRVRAFTVVSPEGEVLTEMRIRLRNRLRRSLSLMVPEETTVRSVLLDGRPVKPSRDEQGALRLPLKRSAGDMQLAQVSVQVVLASKVEELDFYGRPELALPPVELPVSSLGWSIFLPSMNIYGALGGQLPSQQYAGSASWRPPSSVQGGYETPQADLGVGLADGPGGPSSGSADTGAMPVRIKLPTTGARLEYDRYWIAPEQPVSVSFTYVRRWVIYPVMALAFGLLVFGLWWLASPFGKRLGRLQRGLAASLVGLASWPLHAASGLWLIVPGAALGLALIGHRRGWLRATLDKLGEWFRSMPMRFRERDRAAAWTPWRIVWQAMLALCLTVAGIMLLNVAFDLLGQLLISPDAPMSQVVQGM